MAVTDHSLVGLGYAEPTVQRSFVRIAGEHASTTAAFVAEEVPVAVVYNARPHVVVMASPADLEDFAVGFTLTERIVSAVREIEAVSVVRASHGIEVQLQIPDGAAAALRDRGRSLVSRTGCGLCGVETIADALREPEPVGRHLRLDAAALWRAGAALDERQTMNRATNTVHAAAWAFPDGTLRVVREDVGRHNALDKVFGALAREGANAAEGFVIVTSRASYELVQKAAVQGVELLAAISRPTALAIKLAERAAMTLVGLLRGETANVYCDEERRLSV
jgi:formate dehydrogenase accessory protein FdhD